MSTAVFFVASFFVLARAQPLVPTEDACFAKSAAAYVAYKTNGVAGTPDSLIPHLYEDYRDGTLPGVFCYTVNVTDVTQSTLIGSYLGGKPGRTLLEVEPDKTREQVLNDYSPWTDYHADPENLCCGPEKSFYYCAPRIGESRNITDCRQDPQYTFFSSNTTTLATLLSNDANGDEMILCGCVLGLNTSESIVTTPIPGVDQIIQQYSSGVRFGSGIPAALVAVAMATAFL